MGRTPQPTTLKVTRGNPGKHQINDREPTPPRASLDAPAGLEGIALEKWAEMAVILSNMGVFTVADRGPLQRYCLNWEQWIKLESHVREHGATQVTSTGYSQVTAESTLARALRAELLAIERQFGLTPASRSSIKVSDAAAIADPLEAYIQSRSA